MNKSKNFLLVFIGFLLSICLVACGKNSDGKIFEINMKKNNSNYSDKEWVIDANQNGIATIPLKIKNNGTITVTHTSTQKEKIIKKYNVKKGKNIKLKLNISEKNENVAGMKFTLKATNTPTTKVYVCNPYYMLRNIPNTEDNNSSITQQS